MNDPEPFDVMVESTLGNLRVVCAWHPKYFGTEKVMREAAPGWEAKGVSDSICEECRGKFAHEACVSEAV